LALSSWFVPVASRWSVACNLEPKRVHRAQVPKKASKKKNPSTKN